LILDLIDTGGMGTVFKAIHRPMNRIVAIKMISKNLLASSEQAQRFLREVRVAATLENVNIVRAYDADRFNGFHFLVMEFVQGENLAKIVRRDGPLTVEQAIDCVRQAANGIRYAHSRGIVHRDIKPGNLMRTNGEVIKVLDLGLADVDESFRATQESQQVNDLSLESHDQIEDHLTNFGAVLGTASFMAPEQSRDATSADNRSDIYSLGCTLYYLLIGNPPYQADTCIKILKLHRESEVASLRQLRPDVPISVDAILLRMLAKNPQERFQSMDELITAIDDCGLNLFSSHPYAAVASNSISGRRTRHAFSSNQWWHRGMLSFLVLLTIFIAGTGVMMMLIIQRWDNHSRPNADATFETPRSIPDPDSISKQNANWGYRQFGPERTSFNPHESVIAPANVRQLEVKWKNKHSTTIRWGVCVVDGIAYYGDYSGGFHAADVSTGKILWSKRLDGKHQGHVIIGRIAYITSINQLYVCDARTGSTLWTRYPPSGQFGGLIVVDDICYVRTNSPPKLHALTLDGGDELWQVPGGMTASNGREIWNVAGGAIAIADGMLYKTSEQTLQAIDTTNGSTCWEVTIPEGRLTGPAVTADTVYVNSSAGVVYAYDVTDRERQNRPPIWTGKIPIQDQEDGPQIPAVGHGTLFVGANNCFYAFDAAPEGQSERVPIWETPVEAAFFSALPPSVANGVVYSTAGCHDLIAFDAEHGKVLWEFRTQGTDFPMRSTPTIANGKLYHAATFDRTLYTFGLPDHTE
ncbi:MAG: serine/threonine-protein kinase, partial [Rubripirellula sp.]|nr:serine/threonine-protein kinase [Rubripirellula sp.]